MSKAEIIEKTPMSLTDLKAEITRISKRDEETGFRTGKTLEYVNSFSALSKTAYVDLKKKIEELNVPRLKEEHITKILDILPKTENDVAVVLQGYTLTVSKENIKKIVDIIKSGTK